MDQLASAAGVEGHALLVDCRSLDFRPVAVPDDLEIVVVDSGEARTLVGSAYAERRAQAEMAEMVIGPLRDANTLDLQRLDDPILAARARHVITENARVWAFAEALEGGWPDEAGALMAASHASLRDDYEVSTPALDALVERLSARPGVYGARLTGAGFGGCVVALTDPGVLDEGWKVRPAAGASGGDRLTRQPRSWAFWASYCSSVMEPRSRRPSSFSSCSATLSPPATEATLEVGSDPVELAVLVGLALLVDLGLHDGRLADVGERGPGSGRPTRSPGRRRR